ncbi:response regulator transcription factor [Aeromonas hydrophila]|uniref:response regulator transcription factor n=1 Tax=Aeromonas hydrophila TaxID=644 RepID=UPI001C5B514F|nr:response regulator [Aeromonas hydrophila]MBW3817239.1 response regulator [Aeromonas hydrophila]MCF7677999.1 response regulator transcription factor [Aeromonas hydrophila]MCF7691052.1 response regulator transcription factor [Aeromonas hydrophila]MCF7772199.1 response regulator transcription factor [Aeromonas hydrophila]
MEQCIWLIDDDAAIRDSLSLLLSTVGWRTHAYENAQIFQQNAGDLCQLNGCMLLDIRMPGKTGLTLLEEWALQGLSLPVIVVTGHGNIDLCRRAFKNGAFEFLTKPIDANMLFEVVGTAMEQQKAQFETRKIWQQRQEKLASLTAREKEMLAQLIQGYSSKEIAQQYSLSPRTVEAHRANIFIKLEVNSLPKLLKTYGDSV